MNCCLKCFEDKVLISQIRRHGQKGSCNFCGSQHVLTLKASTLLSLFKPLFDEFEHVDSDDPRPSSLLPLSLKQKPEWKIFSKRLSLASRKRLLRFILSLKEIEACGKWTPRMGSIFWRANEAIWWNFSECIKKERRFLLGNDYQDDPKKWLPAFLPSIGLTIPKSKGLFRARLGCHDSDPTVGYQAFPPDQLGAPPKDKITRGGRANPPGIAYLYTAEDEATAVAEIKPYIGAFVSTVAFRGRKTLTVVDLTRVHRVESPFGHANLSDEIRRCDLLRYLNEELAEPINPERDSIDYTPCQYVVEVIRDSGFDGVRYRSAMRKGGFNIVFFDPENLKPSGKARLVRVREQKIAYQAWKPPASSL